MSTDAKSTYYDWGGVESLEVCQRKLNIIEYIGACKFMILKYTMRMARKGDPVRDAEKVTVYSTLLEEAQRRFYSDEFDGDTEVPAYVVLKGGKGVRD